MNMSVSYYSARGGRDKNEDTVTILESNDAIVGIVADGLGGHACGEIASKTAANAVNAQIAHSAVSPVLLRKAIQYANDQILQNEFCRTMRTTIAVLWLGQENGVAGTLGDTRFYHFRNQGIVYQSTDHSVAQMSVNMGELAPEELRGSAQRHQLTKALGAEEEIRPEIRDFEICPGDAFLLCSDGFWENVVEEEMLRKLRESDTAGEWLQGMKRIVEKRMNPSGDNHSAVAIWVK